MRTSKNGKALKLISSAQITLSKIYDAYTINLSNSNFDIVCNDQGDALAGEIGANGRAITTTSVVMGTKKLTAVASNPTAEQYCISISAQVGCTAAKNGNDKVYINTLSSSIAGKISISFNIEGTTTVVKDVTFVKKMNDSPNFIDGQFSFGTGYWSTTKDGIGVLGSNVTIKKSNEAIYGTNLLEIVNDTWFYSKKYINIEKDRIYKCRFRAKQSIDNTTGGKIAYFGYTPYNSSGTAIGTSGADNMYFKSEALKTNAWTEWEYYVSTTAKAEVSTTVNGVKKVITPAVQAFPTGAVKFKPMFIVNYNKGNGIALVDGWILEDVTEKFEISKLEYKASQIETTVNGIDANVVTIKTYTDMSSNPMTLVAKANYSAYDTPNQGEVYLHGLNDKRNPADVDGKCVWNAKTVSLPKVMFNPNSVVPDGIAIYMVRNISDNKWWSIWKETNNSTITWKRTLADVNASTTVYTHTWNEANDIVVGYYIVKKTNPRDGEAPIVIAQLFDGALNYKQATSMTLVGSVSQLEILENEVNLKVANTDNKVSQLKLETDRITQRVQTTETNVSTVTNSLNNLKIGGRNLAKNSPILNNSFRQLGTFVGTRTILNDSIAKSGKVIKVECTAAGRGFWCDVWQFNDSCIGNKYTWSFYAKMNTSKTLGTIGHERGGLTSIAVATEWKKFTHTWTFTTTGNNAFIFYPDFVVGDVLYIRDLKIEEGEKATDWTPAPEDTDNAIANVNTKIENTTNKLSELKLETDKITQRVQSTESNVSTITHNFNNMQIGGSNILRGTNTITQLGNSCAWSTGTWRGASGGTGIREIINITNAPNPNIKKGVKITTTSSTSEHNTDIAQDNVPVVNGVTYTMSCYARKTNGNATLRLQYGKSPYPAKSVVLSTTTWQKYYYTFTVGQVSDGSTGGSTNIYFGLTPGMVGSVEICGFQLERGNKITDWQPAPEDVNTSIANVDSKAESTKNKVAEIETTLDGINLKVQSTEKTVTNHTTQLNQVDGKVNTVTNNFNNLQIGGRNLMPNTNFYNGTNGWGVWNSAHSMSIVTGRFSNTKALQIVLANQAGSGYKTSTVPCIGGKQYTVSFWFKTTIACQVGDLIKILHSNGSETNPIAMQMKSVKANEWTHYSFTFTTPSTAVKIYTTPRIEPAVGTPTVQLTEYMLEESTKASSWTPAPEDIDSSIANVNTKVDTSMSQIEMLNNKIGLKVEKNNVIASINLYTQTNENGSSSGIKIKGDKIDLQGQVTFSSLADSNVSGSIKNIFTQQNNQTVINGGMIKTQTIKGNDLLLKGNLTVTDSSSNKTFEITSNGDVNIQAKSLRIGSANVATNNDVNNAINNVQVGGRNLIPNSAPKINNYGWAGAAGSRELVTESTAPFGYAMKATFTANATSQGGMYAAPKTKLVSGKVYSWSVWLKASKSMTINVGMEQNGRANCAVTTSWQKFTHKFTANDHSNYAFVMYAQAPLSTGDYYLVHSIMVEEGNKPGSWSPAPEDVESAINTKIDNNQTTIFNKLFSNGQQGFVLENGKVYINGEVIKANVISGSAIKAGTLDASKIKAGIIQASSGGSYLDLNNGSMMLGTTSLSNYLQWTGSQLNIKANSISIGSSALATTTDINNAIKNVQIGGRNLAKKGCFSKYNTGSDTTVTDTNFLKDGSVTFSRKAVINEGPTIDRYVVYEAGKEYVISFKIKKTAGTVNSIHVYNGCSHTNSSVYIDGVKKGALAQDLAFPTDTNYHKVEIYFTAGSTNRGDGSAINTVHTILQPMKGTAGTYTMEVSNFKIERGNRPTDWDPAPEDVRSSIDGKVNNTQQDIFNKLFSNGQQGFVLENGKVYINGEVIKANAIRGSVISAINMSSESATINSAQIGNIDASKITTGFISANRLDASTLVSKINGGYTSISGDKIRTGIIRANSGGSYIDLNDGTMQLGTTSKSNYLQWNGSTLTIKGHLNTCTFRGKNMVYIEDNGTLSCDGQTYIRHLSVLETHPGWAYGTRGSFDCAPTANFAKEVRTAGEFWARNNSGDYLGVIRRGAGGSGKIQIDRMRVINEKHGSANNYIEVACYNSPHVFGIDLWSSDEKLKENIVSVEDNNIELLNDDTSKTGLNLINNLNHYAYDYKKSFGGDHVTCGYVAQELQELNDSLVMEIEQQDGTTLLQPKASNIIPNLSLAIKQQQKMIDDLKAEIELLKSKLNN